MCQCNVKVALWAFGFDYHLDHFKILLVSDMCDLCQEWCIFRRTSGL